MNRAIIMGRLTRDPEVRYTSGDNPKAIARYTLAVDRRGSRGSDQTADFIKCVAFDRAGEFSEKYFSQGMRVLVSGRIQTGSYTDKEGRKIYTTEVVVDDQEFADGKGKAGQQDGQQAEQQDRQQAEQQDRQQDGKQDRQQEPKNDIGDGFMQIPDGVDDEGLPFD